VDQYQNSSTILFELNEMMICKIFKYRRKSILIFSIFSHRRFKTDIPSSVSKGAPDFCTVYVIAKGKISNVRPASASLPSAAKTSPRDTHTHNQASHHSDNFNHASHHSDHHHPGGTHFMRNHHFRGLLL